LISTVTVSVLASLGDQRFLNPVSPVLTSDDRHLFIPQHSTAWMSIVNLVNPGGGFNPAIEGGFPTGVDPAMAAFSPDEKYLYVASFEGSDPTWSAVCRSETQSPSDPPMHKEASIQVIDVQRALSKTASPILATLKAGCRASRVAVSPDGNTLFATATLDNALLAFDVRPLQRGAIPTLIGRVPVGSDPVGLAVMDEGRKVVVANSNFRSAGLNDHATLTVIDTGKIAGGSSAIIATIPVGADPRNISATPDGRTLLVSNHLSGTLQIIDLAALNLKMTVQPASTQSGNTNCSQPLADPIVHIPVGGIPRFPVASRDGCWIFFAQFGPNGVVVMRRESGVVRPFRFVPMNAPLSLMALTHDEKILIVHGSDRATFLDVAKLTSGQPDPVLGYIGDRHFAADDGYGVLVTADDRYLFLGQGRTNWITVIDLERARTTGFGPAAIIGGIPTSGEGPHRFVISQDGRYLYSPGSPPGTVYPSELCKSGPPGAAPQAEGAGILVIDVARATSNAASPIIAATPVGCGAGALALSVDGNSLYITSRRGNALRTLDLRPVQTGSAPILVGEVLLSASPVDVALIKSGGIVVANSRGWTANPNDDSDLTVVDANKIISGASAVLGTIPAGADARNLFVTADGKTLLVSNAGSKTLQIVDLDRLKLEPIPK
jgi:DNA-binding beta-propeller fold protein YncE